jgi:hypothetical protein
MGNISLKVKSFFTPRIRFVVERAPAGDYEQVSKNRTSRRGEKKRLMATFDAT